MKHAHHRDKCVIGKLNAVEHDKISGYVLKIVSNITLVLVSGEMTFGRLERKPLWHCKGSSHVHMFYACLSVESSSISGVTQDAIYSFVSI